MSDSSCSASADGKQDVEMEEKNVITERVTALFGGEVAKLFEEEEITSYPIIADLLKKDADAGIFKNLDLKYGAVVRFKHEFLKLLPADLVDRSTVTSPRLKPTMGAMSGFDPNMKRMYLSKRKRVGILASEHWRGDYPKFNTPEKKAGLNKFASQIEEECGIPEIGFTSEGIAQHIQYFFNEQRRYQKRNNGQQIVRGGQDSKDITPAAKSSKSVKNKSSSTPPSKRFKATEEEKLTSPEQDADSISESGESLSTLSVSDSESESLCSKGSESGIQDTSNVKVPSATGSGTGSQDTLNVKVPSTAASSQLVIKAVFGKVLTREEVVTILNSKFTVKKSQLTSLTASQLLTVLIKKLIKHSYVTLNGCNINNLQRDDVKVHKEIEV
ncbi:hypothetical protein OS493_018783 [Desmophyllum pertusum]|uniref:Uncharacterized protein n=1 Tax=Desmophyllum pertusum TaxID=174260 RepID=A0A9X0CZB0_9CNID|nr:hypothetical protein OS493_018783 [Desmophyllum pertusum]